MAAFRGYGAMSARVVEVAHPPALSLPAWPEQPPAVEAAAASYLVVAVGAHRRTREVAGAWVADAEGRAPTVLVVLDDLGDPRDHAELTAALERSRTGARILIVGGQYDVLRALAIAGDAGAIDAELAAFCVHTRDLPMYCAHCGATHRVFAGPGDEVGCPGCDRWLEIHPHLARALGSFLASDARAGSLPPPGEAR